MSAVIDEQADKANLVLVSRKFRRKLKLRWKADGEVNAVVCPLTVKLPAPMLALAFAPQARCRLSTQYTHVNPSLWVGTTSFDLE